MWLRVRMCMLFFLPFPPSFFWGGGGDGGRYLAQCVNTLPGLIHEAVHESKHPIVHGLRHGLACQAIIQWQHIAKRV